MPPALPKRKLRNTFFVDTKTTCFLCLQSIPPVIKLDGGDGDGGGECGNDDTSIEHHKDGTVRLQEEKSDKFCLRAIYKYLKINPGKVLSRQLAGNGGGGNSALSPLLNNTDLSVLLCESCIQISVNLSKLCEELEIIQMKVGHSLGRFLEVLRSSETDSRLMDNFRSQLVDPLELLQASVAEHMRKATRNKCKKQLNSFVPRVKIVNFQTNFKTSTSTNVPSKSSKVGDNRSQTSHPPIPPLNQTSLSKVVVPANFKCNLCGSAYGSLSGLQKHKRKWHPNSALTSSSIATARNPAVSLAPKSASEHICNSCGLKLASKSDWIRHTRLDCNSGGFTSPTAIPTITVPPPRPVVTMKPASPLITKIESKLVKPSIFKCTQCGLAYGSRKSLLAHDLRRHRNFTTSSSRHPRMPVATPVSQKCNACGLKLPSKADWIRHTRLYCNHHHRRATITTSTEDAQELPTTPIILEKEPATDNSSLKITMPKAEVLAKLVNPLPHTKTANNQLMCSLCPPSSGDRFNKDDLLRRHLFVFHPEYFLKPVKLPEHSTEQFKQMCEQLLKDEVSSSSQGTAQISSSHGVTFSCTYCSNVCYDRRTMHIHMIQGHYELMASKLVDLQRNSSSSSPSNTLSSSVSEKKMETVRKPTKPINVPSRTPVKGRFQCRDCRKVLTDRSNLRRHRKLYCTYRGRTSGTDNNTTTYNVAKNHETGIMNSPTLRQFKCPDCDARFVHSPSLWRHRKTAHSTSYTVQPQLPVPAKPNNVPKKISVVKGGNACPDCGEEFQYYKSLWRHRQVYKHFTGYTRKEKKFACEGCGKAYCQHHELARHKTMCDKYKRRLTGNGNRTATNTSISHSEVPVVSSIFSLVTSTSPLLLVRQETISSEQSQTPSPPRKSETICDYCGKSFSSSCVMRRHQRQHCPIAKAAAVPNPVNYANNQDYYEEFEEDNQEMEQYPSSYGHTKIEVLDMDQVKLSGTHADREAVENEDLYVGTSNYQDEEYARMGGRIKQEGEPHLDYDTMILPDTADPLQF